MPFIDIPSQRLQSQRINQTSFTQPAEIIGWLGAVQAQDFAAAKWALGLRAHGLTDAAIEQSFNAGEILRTHILRPTWHFVLPADIRWMLMLTSPRVHAFNASYYRKFGLDAETFLRSSAVLEQALQGGNALTRLELEAAQQDGGIQTDDLRATLLVMRAELDGLLCSGPRRGKQFTYMLLEERVPPAPARTREEALVELTLRYFASHGPATLADFVWWSGLAASDARSSLETVKNQLANTTVEGKTYWFDGSAAEGNPTAPRVDLLPCFDEYTVAYTDRSAIFDARQKLGSRGDLLSSYVLVINGQVVGDWKRTIKRNEVIIEVHPFSPLSAAEAQAVAAAASRYGAFLGLPLQHNLPAPTGTI